MKTAIVADFLIKLGGAERVISKLMEMFPDATLYTSIFDKEKCGKVFDEKRIKTSFLQKFPRFLRKRYQILFPLFPYAVESFDLSEYDLVISSSHSFAHGIVTSTDTMHVCYCHSPMRYAYDHTHKFFKEKNLSFPFSFIAKNFLHRIRMWDQVAASRVDYYIANSKHVQRRIEKYYRTSSDILYPPVKVKNSEISWHNDNYYLLVATLTPYKKIDLAINLFNKTGKKLVIVGDGPEKNRLKALAADNIVFEGKVSDRKLDLLYKNCKAFFFPNEEDFGIAMVEAMSRGKPVLAFGKGGSLEIIKEGVSGEFFRSQSINSMENALGKMIVNEHKYKPEIIKKTAEAFDESQFENTLRKLLEKYKKDFQKK